MNVFKTPFFANTQKAKVNFFYGAMAVMLLISVCKDLELSRPRPNDFRNRIVGARMLKDGLSPYFYIWKKGGPVRYYDVLPPNASASMVTGSPFFHSIMGLIADMPQRQLDILWFIVQYLALIASFLLLALALPQQIQKHKLPILTVITVAFSYTVGWRIHVWLGQYYVFIPLLVAGCIYCINKKDGWSWLLLFGLFAASLILLRPVAILFFLPFIFFVRSYIQYGLVTLVTIIFYVIFVLCSPVQKTNWADYFKAIKVHIASHQNFKETPTVAFDTLPIKHFEGVDLESGFDKRKMDSILIQSESSNLYLFYNKVSGKILSVNAMTYIGIAAMALLLLPLFWFIKKGIEPSNIALFALGFILYYANGFCSPITRYNYYWVEFLLPLLLLPMFTKKMQLFPLVLGFTGLCLNIFNPLWVPVRENLGQLLIIIALLYQIYQPLFSTFPNNRKQEINSNNA